VLNKQENTSGDIVDFADDDDTSRGSKSKEIHAHVEWAAAQCDSLMKDLKV
jgi:hypothetical protein